MIAVEMEQVVDLVFIDPQNDVLSEKGSSWDAVGASVTENRTVENMERIFKVAKANGYEVFISPHYFYPADSGWKSTDRLRPRNSGQTLLPDADR
jgi:nicotinamidase-related amidase